MQDQQDCDWTRDSDLISLVCDDSVGKLSPVKRNLSGTISPVHKIANTNRPITVSLCVRFWLLLLEAACPTSIAPRNRLGTPHSPLPPTRVSEGALHVALLVGIGL